MNGKQASVPVCREGQPFNVRMIKQMAGTGAVYVRLTKRLPPRTVNISDDSDFEPSVTRTKSLCDIDSDSSFELPVCIFE